MAHRGSALALTLATTLAAALLAGCPPAPPHSRLPVPATRPVVEAPALGTPPVVAGVYEPLPSEQPLTGDALATGRLSRTEILALVKMRIAPPLPQPPPRRSNLPHSPPRNRQHNPPPPQITKRHPKP